MKELVSVVIPAYNHEKYIQTTIESVIAQTYKNIELLILDDGSSDNTWNKIQEMREKCERRFVRTLFGRQKNQGVMVSLNKLIAEAQGEYVIFGSSDDVLKPCLVEEEYAFLHTHPDYALAVGDNEIIDADGKRAYWDKKRNLVYEKKNAAYLTFGDFLRRHKNIDWVSEQFGSYGSLLIGNYIPNGNMVRKNILDKFFPLPNEVLLEDWLMMLQIAKYGKMKYLDKVLFSYRWHMTNSIKQTQKMKRNSEVTRDKEKEICNNLDLSLVRPEVSDAIKNGFLLRYCGIPRIFEVCVYKKIDAKVRVVKLFSVPVLKFSERLK